MRVVSNRGATTSREAKLLELTAKLALSSALKVRVLTSAVLENICLRTDGVAVASTKASMAAYIQQQNQNKDDKQAWEVRAGPAHVHLYNGLLKTFLEHPSPTEAEKSKVREALQGVSGWQQIAEAVKVCRISRMYSSASKRLEVFVPYGGLESDQTIPVARTWKPLRHWLLSLPGSRQMVGQPPAGDLERQIQQLLDAVQE